MRNSIRRSLKVQEQSKAIQEGAATLMYDYYANPNAISNNLGWCSHCHSISVHENVCTVCRRDYTKGPHA